MRSLLYEGKVWHERSHPSYRLNHRVFYLGLDLSEIDAVAAKLPVFSRNRFNLFSIRDTDFELLRLRRPSPFDLEPGSQASLVTIPRILGYVFNPVSFLIIRDVAGAVTHVEAEVHNTWGERHVYNLARRDGQQPYRSQVTKAFYVSPFLEDQGKYSFEIEEDSDGRLSILIVGTSGSESRLTARLALVPKALSTAGLLGTLIRYPLLNLRVIGAIHFHALRIWLRGAKFHSHRRAASAQPEAGD